MRAVSADASGVRLWTSAAPAPRQREGDDGAPPRSSHGRSWPAERRASDQVDIDVSTDNAEGELYVWSVPVAVVFQSKAGATVAAAASARASIPSSLLTRRSETSASCAARPPHRRPSPPPPSAPARRGGDGRLHLRPPVGADDLGRHDPGRAGGAGGDSNPSTEMTGTSFGRGRCGVGVSLGGAVCSSWANAWARRGVAVHSAPRAWRWREAQRYSRVATSGPVTPPRRARASHAPSSNSNGASPLSAADVLEPPRVVFRGAFFCRATSSRRGATVLSNAFESRERRGDRRSLPTAPSAWTPAVGACSMAHASGA